MIKLTAIKELLRGRKCWNCARKTNCTGYQAVKQYKRASIICNKKEAL